MKRLVGVVLSIFVLCVVFTTPASATNPTEVSGRWTDSAYGAPPQMDPCGLNCLVTAPMWHDWGDGSFRGRDESDWRIMGHGPCATTKPNCCHANLNATGTFTGDLCLGEWAGDVCQGEMYSGSFDFVLQWQVTNPDPDDWTVDTFTGKLVILQGYDGFQGLHGVLEQWGRTGPHAKGGRVEYAGQVHFDPQP